MWTYQIGNGRLFTPDKQLKAIGYSGHGKGLNNPEMTDVKDTTPDGTGDAGPLPCGMYTFGPLTNSTRTGKNIMHLIPDEDNEMFGRGDFECHGDLVGHAGEHLASHGCMIHNLITRLAINASEDRRLKVIP